MDIEKDRASAVNEFKFCLVGLKLSGCAMKTAKEALKIT